jgi:hypothetical protein
VRRVELPAPTSPRLMYSAGGRPRASVRLCVWLCARWPGRAHALNTGRGVRSGATLSGWPPHGRCLSGTRGWVACVPGGRAGSGGRDERPCLRRWCTGTVQLACISAGKEILALCVFFARKWCVRAGHETGWTGDRSLQLDDVRGS